MASTRSARKGRSGRVRPLGPGAGAPRASRQIKQGREKSQTSDRGRTIRIHGRLREFLNSEHGFLLKVESLLLCIAKSMDDGIHPDTGLYYPDVVELAAQILRRRARTFDQLLFDGRLPKEQGP